MKNLTIIGGTDGFGKWLAIFLNQKFTNLDITITGINDFKLQEMNDKYGFNIMTDNIKAVENADITIFSVPIAISERIMIEVCPHIKPGSIVLDVTSIKGFTTQAMRKYSPESVLVIPTHPMFGPYITSIAGQIIALTPEVEVREDSRYQKLKKFLEAEGAKVIETTPREHDKMMAIVQGLTHFDMFVLGETIHKLGVNIQDSMDFVSPIYKIMISSVARYVGQNPKLYADIQMYNPQVLEVHRVFMQVTEKFNNLIKEKNESGFIETINKTKKYFGADTEFGQKYTDKIIYLLGRQQQQALDYIGKEITIQNIYSNEIISGTLNNYINDIFHINNKEYDALEYVIIK